MHESKPERINRLLHEKSPYLQQHAANPVDWYPWGEEAFQTAARENKPVFLSIGYSTCHWCHVMAHESFENDAIASLMNVGFVNIKVDREERPDVDAIYMHFIQNSSGHGGWPMSVWLTPERKPFYGGTYFPPEDRYGRPGFPTVLSRIQEIWADPAEQEKIRERSGQILNSLRGELPQGGEGSTTPHTLLKTAGARAMEGLCARYDSDWGGFGEAPKFPRPALIDFLFSRAQAGGVDAEDAREMATFTLRKMSAGGMYDHLGGGFHRYSVDAFWHVPHFEKMLYDQAQLVPVLLEAWRRTGEESFADTARETLDYTARELTSPQGGFYSAEDADSPLEADPSQHAEGAFYTWRAAEITELLSPEEMRCFSLALGVQPDGNVDPASDPHGELNSQNVLIRRMDDKAVADATGHSEEEVRRFLQSGAAKLFERRLKRPRPHLDDKVLAGWNGLMISAFARAAFVLDDAAFYGRALAAARFVRGNMTNPGTGSLARAWRQRLFGPEAFAWDHAALIGAALDLHEISGDDEWLDWALDLQERMEKQFTDAQGGGYFETPEAAPDLLLRMQMDHDGAEPSTASLAVENLRRLALRTGKPDFEKRAWRVVASLQSVLAGAPGALPGLIAAGQRLAEPAAELVIVGEDQDPATAALIAVARRHGWQGLDILQFAPGTLSERSKKARPWLAGMALVNGNAAAYLCEGGACRAPVDSPEILRCLITRTN